MFASACKRCRSGNRAAGGRPLWESTTALGAVLVDTAGRRRVIEHRAAFTSVLGEADPSATVRGVTHPQGYRQGGCLLPKDHGFWRRQTENEGATAAHRPTLTHTDVAGSLVSETGDQVRWHRSSVLRLPAGFAHERLPSLVWGREALRVGSLASDPRAACSPVPRLGRANAAWPSRSPGSSARRRRNRRRRSRSPAP